MNGGTNGGTRDLSGDVLVTSRLIGQPYDWRVRAVEHIEIDTATHCLRRRSLQCEPLRPLLTGIYGLDLAAADEVLAVVPLVALPRGPLLDLDVWGPRESPAYVVPRHVIGEREAAYLCGFAQELGLDVPAEVRALLTYALGFTEGPWAGIGVGRGRRAGLRGYLASGLDELPDDEEVAGWLTLSERAGELLRPHADSTRRLSAPEEPALVVPALVSEVALTLAEVSGALQAYVHLLDTAVTAAAAGDSGCGEWLTALADYGRYYDLMVVARLPLDEPFLLQLQERRALTIRGPRNTVRQEIVLADARSNHVTMRVGDPNARMSAPAATTPSGGGPAYLAATWTTTEQVHSFYASDYDRDYRAVVVVRLAILRRLQAISYLVSLVLVLLVVALLTGRPGTLRDVGLVVGPAALAASVILAREPSTLGSRLRRTSSVVLLASLGLVILAAGYVYVRY